MLLFLDSRGPARAIAIAVVAVATAVAAGCSTPPIDVPRPPPLTADAHADRQHLAGRFAMTDSERVPEERHASASGLFVVERNADGLSLTLSSPLGQTLAQARHRPGQPAELVTQNGDRLTGDTLDEVFYQAIGVRVPAERLPDWLEGRFSQVLERSPDGQRVRAIDDGWQIDRNGNRWNFVQDNGTRRIEVRLVADPT